MKNFLKSPILWAVIGIALLIIGNIYSDKEKYPSMPIISRLIMVAGAITIGFSLPFMINWSPLTKISA